MFELTIFLFSVVTCVIIAISVWLTLKSIKKTRPANSESSSRSDDYVAVRSIMQFGDWVNTVILVFLGIILGIVIDALMQLLTTALWPVAIIIPLIFAGVLLFGKLFDEILNRIFPGGIRPARKPQVASRKPLPRLLSLPVGLIIGIIMVRLGYGDAILRMIS